MNGILDTLVLRERGQAEALAPRLPALFESTPAVDEPPVLEERTVVQAKAQAAPAAPPPQRARANDAPPMEAARPVKVFTPPPSAPQAVHIDSAPVAAPAAPSPQPVTIHTVETRTLPVVRVERETISVQAARPTVPPPPQHQSSATQQPPEPPAPAQQTVQPVRTQAAPAPVVPARAPVDVRVVPARPPQTERAQPLQPRQRAIPQPAAAPQPVAPAQAPDVHITIGRVEVRATTAPVRPARAAGGPAPVSLDQYLSQRNKQGTP